MADSIKPPSNTLNFFMEVGKLKFLRRTGWVMRNIKNCESVAGHMYRMAVMAFLLDEEVLNRDRCIKMALIHDMPECIVGDLTPFCGVSKEDKHKQEMEAMNRLCSLVGEEIGKELLSLFMEYEEQKTTEAKAVKDLDKFDMLLQAFEYEADANFALSLQDFFDNTKGFQNKTVLNWLEDLQWLRSKNPDGSETKIPKSSIFELFLLIGKLKHRKIKCSNPDEHCECDTFADHSYRLSIMAFLLNDSTSSGLNNNKCIKMALIHNILMSTSHKNFATCLLTEEKTVHEDMLDMQRIICCLDERVQKEFLDLFEEYQAQNTLEAKFVKDLDEFEISFQTYEYGMRKVGPKNHFALPSNHSFQNTEVLRWANEVQMLTKETQLLQST